MDQQRKGGDEAKSELEKAIEQLNDSRELLHSIGDVSLASIACYKAIRDNQNRIIDFEYVFQSRADRANYKHQDLTGKRVTEINPGISHTEVFTRFVHTVESGESQDFESHYGHEDPEGWFRIVTRKMGDGLVTSTENITAQKKAKQESEERTRYLKEVYQSVVKGAKVEDSLQILTQLVISETSGKARTAFYVVSEDGTVLHPLYGAGNMQKSYLDEIDKFPIGKDSLACGLAVQIGKPITTPDVFEEPLWKSWTFIAKKYDFRGCWSFPIKTRDDKAIGTFAMYFQTRGEPSEQDLSLADIVTRTAAVVISNHSDNIDRTRAERALAESEQKFRGLNAKLKEMDEAKTNFFNNVSHEFRTPLTLLIGPLEDIIKNPKSKIRPDDIQKLQMSHRSAIRLQKLVNSLLDFARIEAGKLEAFFQPTDFSTLTTDLASNFRSAIEKADLKYKVKTEPIHEPIYLNREMWEKIVFNLLSNAFKFTRKGKIEVAIRNKKKNVEFRVKDTGIGIAPKNTDRIFERFARIEGTHARTFEGTGIGLALVRELVQANGGTIKVKSQENVGSEFIVSIPKGKSHLPARQIYENKEKLGAGFINDSFIEEARGWLPENNRTAKRNLNKFLRHKGHRVVVAEDNADMRGYLTSILSDDYQILTFENGQKVVDFLTNGGQVNLILADVMMPELSGYNLAKQLKSNPAFSDIPIILVSANGSEKAKIEGFESGADDYLAKPFSASELLTLVKVRINRASRKNSTPP